MCIELDVGDGVFKTSGRLSSEVLSNPIASRLTYRLWQKKTKKNNKTLLITMEREHHLLTFAIGREFINRTTVDIVCRCVRLESDFLNARNRYKFRLTEIRTHFSEPISLYTHIHILISIVNQTIYREQHTYTANIFTLFRGVSSLFSLFLKCNAFYHITTRSNTMSCIKFLVSECQDLDFVRKTLSPLLSIQHLVFSISTSI